MKVRTNVSTDKETMAKMRELAAAQHMSVSQWITNKVWEEARKDDIRDRLTAEPIQEENSIEVN